MINTADIFSISTSKQFEEVALEVFQFQYANNSVYRDFCNLLKTNPAKVGKITEIPFLPIQFFKSHSIITQNPDKPRKIEQQFTSSGTGREDNRSNHFVTDIGIYINSFRKGFEYFYGNANEYAILALLPSYLERKGSSLIYMVEDLIELSRNEHSGFYLHNYQELTEKLVLLESENQKILLIGVTYALLDLVEKQKLVLPNTIVMETGGMKGKRKEIVREELHLNLCNGFGIKSIHSEYGMTELLSQAYSHGNGLFNCPPWMQLLIREPQDSLSYLPAGKTGGINVIDLANINSCSFIATQDLGRKHPNDSFEVLGRFDNADIRGCNLLMNT